MTTSTGKVRSSSERESGGLTDRCLNRSLFIPGVPDRGPVAAGHPPNSNAVMIVVRSECQYCLEETGADEWPRETKRWGLNFDMTEDLTYLPSGESLAPTYHQFSVTC